MSGQSAAGRQAAHFSSFLVGGGEMGDRIRGYDWSQTSIGAASNWPQSLRTTLGLLLGSRRPMLLWWGPELVQFYNDGYRPSLGAHKHPQALGQRGQEFWAEIWDVIGPQIQAVLARGEETWHEDQLAPFDRHGFLEEIYFTYEYSPVRDEAGGVAGVLAVCTETTRQVLAHRRLRLLRELAGRMVEPATKEAATRLGLEALRGEGFDVPYALFYQLTEDGTTLRLAGNAGLPEGHPACPATLNHRGSGSGWPAWHVLEEGQAVLVEDLESRFGKFRAGPWPEAAGRAFILPVTRPGQRLEGILVAGTSPRLAFDHDYRVFLALAASQMGTALANAHAHQQEALQDREEPLSARQRERLEMADRNGMRLVKLVNTLLDFSRVESGRIQAVYEPTDLAALTGEVASAFRSAVEKAGIQLVIDCERLAEPVFVDREMWEKIVLNLVSNAFKFTFEGTITVSIQGGEQAELRVSDTGTGIPQAELPHIFERFRRVQGASGRSFEGSGIGLALVRELVRLHGGTIEVTSTADQGSTFRVRIPWGSSHLPADSLCASRTLPSQAVGSDADIEEALRWLPEKNLSESESCGNPRILVAEDNPDMRDYLRRILGSSFEVEVAENGSAALAKVRNRPPDLVLADGMMPNNDGFELLRQLRSDSATKEIAFILLSARPGEEARIDGLQAGADDYLIKPFSSRELVTRVTAALRTSRVRRESSDRLRAVLETITDAFCTLDRQWRVTYINHEALRIGGKSREEIVGRIIWELFPAAAGTAAYRECQRALEKRVPVRFEQYFAHAGLWLSIRAYPIQDGLAIFALDITERRLTEHRLVMQYEIVRLLAESETLRDAIPQTLRMVCGRLQWDIGVFWEMDPQSRSVRCSDFWCDPAFRAPHFEQATRELQCEPDHGVPAEVWKSGEPLWVEDIAKVEYFLRAAAAAEDGLHSGFWVPVTVGRAICGVMEFTVRSVREPDKDVLQMMASVGNQIGQFIERKKAEMELVDILEREQAARAEADAANRTKDQFLAMVSHELRTPLHAIVGWAHLLGEGDVDVDMLDRAVRAIQRNAKVQAQLIDDLLDVSRIVAGNQQLVLGDVRLAEVIEATVESVRTAAEARGVEIRTELDPQVMIHGDHDRLRQVFWNLLSNAVKFTNKGGEVKVRLFRAESVAHVVVRDTGQGISSQLLPRLFERFRQGDSSSTRSHGGLGLGLAIVRHLVELHGGSVEAASGGEGLGSTFCVKLPEKLGQPEPVRKRLRRRAATLQGIRVLAVEDEPDARDLFALVLEGKGAEVKTCGSVSEALEVLASWLPTLMIADIGMPGEDGYSLIRKVRRMEGERANLPAIAVTAYARSEDRDRALAEGYQMHLAKPVEPDELVKLVRGMARRAARKSPLQGEP